MDPSGGLQPGPRRPRRRHVHPARFGGRPTGDLLGRRVQRGDGVLAIEGDEAGAHRVEDHRLEGLEVLKVATLMLQLLTRRPELLGQSAGDDRDDEERPGIEEDGEDFQRRRLVGWLEERGQREDRAGEHEARIEEAPGGRDGDRPRAGKQHARSRDRQHVQKGVDRPRTAGGGNDRGDQDHVEEAQQPRDPSRLDEGRQQEQGPRRHHDD